jgi:hypothetical protein
MLAAAMGAGVVEGEVEALRRFLGNIDAGVDLAFFLAGAKRDFDLLGRVFVD